MTNRERRAMEDAMSEEQSRPESGQKPNREEIGKALAHWSQVMEQLLAMRYGKGNMGHILIVTTLGTGPSVSWIGNLDLPSTRVALENVAKHLANVDEKQIMVRKEYFGG